MALKVRFEWRMVSDEGQLVMPYQEGPAYYRCDINTEEPSSGFGFESRESALQALDAWIKKYDCSYEFVLLELFSKARS